jgi:hypothetical protein
VRRLAACAALAGCGAPVYLPQEPPLPPVDVDDTGPHSAPDGTETPDLPCSGPGSVAVTLTIDNRSDVAVDVFWVDGTCVEVLYLTVAAGTTFALSSFDTHVWLARELTTHTYAASRVLDDAPAQTLVVR